MPIKTFRSAAEFRKWLEENHDCVTELWLGMYNQRTDKKSITYREALDEALCFGWIDGLRKSIDSTTYQQRFTPRKPKSYWSAVNTKRWNELVKLGRVWGVEAFDRRSTDSVKYSFESRPKKLPAAYVKQFRAKDAAWKFFRAQAPWYQRTSSFWVVCAKQEETRQRRLAKLMADSEKGRRLDMLTPKTKEGQGHQRVRPQANRGEAKGGARPRPAGDKPLQALTFPSAVASKIKLAGLPFNEDAHPRNAHSTDCYR